MVAKVVRQIELAALGAGRGQSVKVRLVEFGVGVRLDIRRYWIDEHGTEAPTQKGVVLKPEWLAQIRAALNAFERGAASKA